MNFFEEAIAEYDFYYVDSYCNDRIYTNTKMQFNQLNYTYDIIQNVIDRPYHDACVLTPSLSYLT